MVMRIVLVLTALMLTLLTVLAAIRATGYKVAISATTYIADAIPEGSLPWIGVCLIALALLVICVALWRILRLLDVY